MNEDMKKEILKLDNQLCFRLYTVSKNMTRFYQPYLKQHNLTYPQYIVMLVVFEEQEIDFRELSTKVDLRTGTLTPILQKLEEHGFITREVNAEDKRKMTIKITDKGIKLREEIIDVPLGMYGELNISEDSYHTLVKELDELLQILKDGFEKKGE